MKAKILVFIQLCCLSTYVYAALHARDLDPDSAGIEAYYDDVLDVTWLTDANLAKSETFGLLRSAAAAVDTPGFVGSDGRLSWDNAKRWIEGMNSAEYLGFNDWRLPTMMDTASPGCDLANVGTDCGYNVQTFGGGVVFSELGYMYYDNLGAIGVNNPDDSGNPASIYGLDDATNHANLALFINIENKPYWTGLEFAPALGGHAWLLFGQFGLQNAEPKDNNIFVWPVLSGDVIVAEEMIPATSLFFLFVLAVLFYLAFRSLR